MQNQLKMGATGKTKYDLILSILMFLYCVALPFEEALASSFGSILRLIGIAIVGYSFFRYSKKTIKKSTLRLVAPFLLWLLWSFVSVFWSKDFSWWSYFFMIYLVQIVFIVAVIFFSEYINSEYIKSGLIIGATIASALLIFMGTDTVLTNEGRRTIVIFGKGFDPNIVASIIVLGLFSVIDKVFSKNKKRKIYIVLMLFLAIGMLYTGSRGALISFVGGFGIQLLLELRKKKARKTAMLMLVIAFIGVIVALAVLPPELLLSRFSKETLFGINELKNGEHNRYTIWGYALVLIEKSPIIGYGCGNFFSVIATVYKECASHNMYILIMFEEGIIGFLIFMFGIVRLLKQTYKRQLYSVLGMLSSVCIVALTLDSLTSKYFWIAIIVTAISIREHDLYKEINDE